MNVRRFISAIAVACLVAITLPRDGIAAGNDSKTAVAVDCRCPDRVGQDLCSVFKEKVNGSPGYRLADGNSAFGIGVHFACVDLWQGINNGLSGRMSAVSVTFTIFSDKLPGEVYEDSSVSRVGKDATADMSAKILAALGQIVNLNAGLFDKLRAGANSPTASPTPFVYPAPPKASP